MNWDAIGAIGEVFGGAVVVVTIVYLAIQIRQNRQAVQAETEFQAAIQLSRMTQRVADDKDLQRGRHRCRGQPV